MDKPISIGFMITVILFCYFFLVHAEEILINCIPFSVSSAYRTAICKAKRGGFKDTFAEDLLVPVFKVCALLGCFPFCIFIIKSVNWSLVGVFGSSYTLSFSIVGFSR